MTNFDFLRREKKFDTFSNVAISAEKLFSSDIEASAISCRKAMEFAVKWMYSVDKDLEKPYKDNIATLLSMDSFRRIVGFDISRRLDYIRKVGNNAAHKRKRIKKEQVELCLENLFVFCDFIAYCYADDYKNQKFNKELLNKVEHNVEKPIITEIELNKLVEANKNIKSQLTERRNSQITSYVKNPLELSEYNTRKNYIDAMLCEAGWVEGKNWINEVEVFDMPNKSGEGFADYVLYDDSHKPLAVIEAKRTCVDVSKGRQQAKLYADYFEKKYKRRPVIFLTNGFETRIIDGKYQERNVATIYSKRDLEKLFNLYSMRTKLSNITINNEIAGGDGRYYQTAAIKAVCNSLDKKYKRKALIVMATGAGKTRTIIALCDVLLKCGWVKNILFLADRNSLVTQAKRSFVNLLPNLSVVNLVEDKENYNAHCVFSTYQTMMNCIDDVQDEDGKIFSNGHFDLVICDEAHRSIYNKYKDIFNYFDAPLIGLTATPKDEIDKNTYEIFELEKGVPTYGYDLAQAVKDGFLVDFVSVETGLKFIEQGISYEELSEEDKIEYEETFIKEDGEMPEKIKSSALNEWVFNEDTIKKVLNTVMEKGIKVDSGEKIGKTILFAKNHKHAEKILEIFNKEYPHLKDYAKVIDNYLNYAQSAIDEFSEAEKLPQIAISVDMLDTGIDIPEVVNLVFFKKVMSKAKFWQMIGRGTRLCPGLIDGKDKNRFYIFDFCGNFEFFRMSKGKATANMLALQSIIFNRKFEIAFSLQDLEYQVDRLVAYRKALVDDMVTEVRKINRDSFAAKQHIRYIDYYSDEKNYNSISFEDIMTVKEEVSPLVLPNEDEINAIRFDALVYQIELALLSRKTNNKSKSELLKKVNAISKVSNIPEIIVKKDIIEKILNTDYLETADINTLEYIRNEIRSLVKYIPKDGRVFNTHFDDEILSEEWKDSELSDDVLKDYKAKVEFYIREHTNNDVIKKLKTNVPLTHSDVKKLEKILWSDLGTKDEYSEEVGNEPLGEFIRGIVGLDMDVAKKEFSDFLNNNDLDEKQIYFVNQIIEYIVHNGVMKDFSVLQEAPFTDRGSIVDIFADSLPVWDAIRNVIERINNNAVA